MAKSNALNDRTVTKAKISRREPKNIKEAVECSFGSDTIGFVTGLVERETARFARQS